MTQKYEREIEEILRGLDEFVPEEPIARRIQGRVNGWYAPYALWLRGLQSNWRRYLTVQWLMVASISLIMLGFLLRMFSLRLASYANTLGFLLFVAVLVVAVLHIGGARRRRIWRGQELNVSHYEAGWWRALQRRWRRWWRGHG